MSHGSENDQTAEHPSKCHSVFVLPPPLPSLTRLVGPADLLAPGLTHVPPGDAPVSAQPDVHGALGVPALSHQLAELAHERPRLALLRHQLADGSALHELARHGIRPQRQPPGEACDRPTRGGGGSAFTAAACADI